MWANPNSYVETGKKTMPVLCILKSRPTLGSVQDPEETYCQPSSKVRHTVVFTPHCDESLNVILCDLFACPLADITSFQCYSKY